MELKKAVHLVKIIRLKQATSDYIKINKEDAEAIDTVLEELNNRIPKDDLKKILRRVQDYQLNYKDTVLFNNIVRKQRKKMSKKTIVFDFDGVIHLGYEGWKDGSIYGEINYGLLWYIKELLNDYYVVISSNRPAEQIVNFLNKDGNNPLDLEVFKKDMGGNMYWTKDCVVGVTNEKAVGILYIDDRGFRYDKDKDTYENIYNINKILGRKDENLEE